MSTTKIVIFGFFLVTTMTSLFSASFLLSNNFANEALTKVTVPESPVPRITTGKKVDPENPFVDEAEIIREIEEMRGY